MTCEIFISYSRGDKDLVHPFAEQINKELGTDCWIDLKGIESGEEFEHVIMTAIDDCKIVLFMLSDRSLSSPWTKREVYYAERRGKRIVPVLVQGDGLRGWFQFHFGNIDYIDIRSDEHKQKLMENLRDWLDKDHIVPNVNRETTKLGTEIHIEVDADCDLFRFKTFVCHLKAGEDNITHLTPGKYKLDFVSAQFPNIKHSMVYTLNSGISCDFIEVKIAEEVTMETVRLQVEEEKTKRKIEEEYVRRRAIDFYNLGRDYYDKEKNYARAAELYKEAAELGHTYAQYSLSMMYEKGRGVPQSDEEAAKWLRKAAEEGYVYAQYYLALRYEKGQGVPQSDEEATKWFRKAAEQGHAGAQLYLGLAYANGRAVPQSDEETVKWFRKAADQGHADAQYNLAVRYEKGRGVSKNKEEAVKWYRKAAEQGHLFAQRDLMRLTGE